MFRETLLESAPSARRRKRWPMILAVALEVTVCSVLIAVPLFSTSVISSVSANPPVILPELDHVRIAHQPSSNSSDNTGQAIPMPRTPAVVTFGDSHPVIDARPSNPPIDDDRSVPDLRAVGQSKLLADCTVCISTTKPRRPERGPYPVSDLTEGYLLHRVEPVYPRLALLTGIHGEVRLHAIISKDGVIESLTLISGHPMLANAAMDAVRQWRYRPYLLNHEPVEVETLITVNFTPGH